MPDGAAVGPVRLEHRRGAGDAAGLEIEQAVDLRGERITRDERTGADQSHLLAVVEQETDWPPQLAAAQRRRGLEQGGDADAGVGGARAGKSAVMVGGE